MNFAEFFLGLFLAVATENQTTFEPKKVELSTSNNVESSTFNNVESQTSNNVESSKRIPYTIYVEGNVGCGKSTFLELFEGNDRIEVVQEPVAEWQNVSGQFLYQSCKLKFDQRKC